MKEIYGANGISRKKKHKNPIRRREKEKVTKSI